MEVSKRTDEVGFGVLAEALANGSEPTVAEKPDELNANRPPGQGPQRAFSHLGGRIRLEAAPRPAPYTDFRSNFEVVIAQVDIAVVS